MLRGVVGGGGSGATLGANTFTGTQTINPAVNTSALVVSGFSLTGTDTHSLIDLAGTWNVGTTVETAIKLNVTDTASGAASLLLDLQVGGVSQASISKAGTLSTNVLIVNATGRFAVSGGVAGLYPATSGGALAGLKIGIFQLDSAASLSWGSGVVSGAADLNLFRDAANILAQRNGANAQTLRVYNTFTDASNYERGVMDWGTSSNVLTIGPQAAGTGTLRNVTATGQWTYSGEVITSASSTTRSGFNLPSGTAPTSPVDGDLWYDGTNLKVRLAGSTKTITAV